MPAAWVIFLLTYFGVAMGRIPGLAVDRTGFALIGAIAMVASGILNTADAFDAIDLPTILLLYSLMVVSSQLRLGGFYSRAARAATRYSDRPRQFLLMLMLVSAGLSAVLANDIVCLAFTPIVVTACARSGLNPIPFLLGLAASSNIGSAATIIGNPQNMLIGQVGRLDFTRFFLWCGVPSALSLLVAFLVLAWVWRGRFQQPSHRSADEHAPPFDRRQTVKGLLVTAAIVVLFCSRLPRELVGLSAAGVLLCSRRMQTRELLGLVDWHLITLFCGLFIVVAGLQSTGLPETLVRGMATRGWALSNRLVLTGIAAILSNVVSNVPAVMLLVKFLDAGDPVAWYALALSSTFAGNLITIGSIANLIVIEQAAACGVRIGFFEHARAGLPITLASFAILVLWTLFVG
ncbi:MAG: anion transporter [Lentisphaeria bacterium]|nr:anion transporter [Lentisphaeria bacterium]